MRRHRVLTGIYLQVITGNEPIQCWQVLLCVQGTALQIWLWRHESVLQEQPPTRTWCDCLK